LSNCYCYHAEWYCLFLFCISALCCYVNPHVLLTGDCAERTFHH
jgi:hypothetical protein